MSNHFFLHIPKNGGTALRRHTEVSCNHWQDFTNLQFRRREVVYGLSLYDWDENVGHVRASDFNEGFLNTYQPFAIVRNPWDRVVSQFEYLMQRYRLLEERKVLIKDYSIDCLDRYLDIYERYVGVDFTWLNATTNFFCQKDYIDDRTHCLRFEHYENETINYLGLTDSIKKLNTTKRQDYVEYYDDKLIQRVADIYKDDIDYFDFDFDTSARKNTYYVETDTIRS